MAVTDVAIEISGARGMDDASWRAESMCRKHPTQWWFAGGQRETVLAKAICAGCVVRGPCLEFAIDRPELLGIWASTTPTERAAMRRAQREAGAGDGPVDSFAAPEVAVAVAEEPEVEDEITVDIAGEHVVQMDLDIELAPERDAEPEPEPVVRPARSGTRVGSGERYELLTPAEAARLLGVTPNTVTRWSRAGSVSAIQTIGGHRRFRRSEIERVLRDANIVAPSDS